MHYFVGLYFGYRETMLQALREVISPAGEKMSPSLMKQVYSTLINLLNHQEDITRSAAAGCLGALCKYLPTDLQNTVITEHLLSKCFIYGSFQCRKNYCDALIR